MFATAASAAKHAAAPGIVDAAKLQSSFADLSRDVLNCYHKTARFQSSDLIQTPWDCQSQYAAENSTVIRIRYKGISPMNYEMIVAVMVKKDKVRTAVIKDNAIVPYSTNCQLEDWTGS